MTADSVVSSLDVYRLHSHDARVTRVLYQPRYIVHEESNPLAEDQARRMRMLCATPNPRASTI